MIVGDACLRVLARYRPRPATLASRARTATPPCPYLGSTPASSTPTLDASFDHPGHTPPPPALGPSTGAIAPAFPTRRTSSTISHAEVGVLSNRLGRARCRQNSVVSSVSLRCATSRSFTESHMVVTRRARPRGTPPQSRPKTWRFLSTEPDRRLSVILWR
jgi:hypothetical protein